MKYNIAVLDGNPSSITVFHGGRPYVAGADHKNFGALMTALTQMEHDDVAIMRYLDIEQGLTDLFQPLSERVSVNGTTICFDGDPVQNALTDKILAYFFGNIDNWKPLVNFFEKVQTNPNEHSRQHLFTWLERNHFILCEDGDFLGYKGVYKHGENGFISSSSGEAMVNGRRIKGRIPTTPGVVVEMPRSKVQHSPGQACAEGLHVGNWRYASTFAGHHVVLVKVNPRDVVSVPSSETEKMRVCRYYVVRHVTARIDAAVEGAGKTQYVELQPIERTLNFDTGPREKPVTEKRASIRKRASKAVGGLLHKPNRGEELAKGLGAKLDDKGALRFPKPKPGDKPLKAGRVAAKRDTDSAVREEKVNRPSKVTTAPKFFEEFRLNDWRNADFITFKQMKWLAKEWDVKVEAPRGRTQYEVALNKAAQSRRKAYASKPRSVKRVNVARAKANATA